MTETDRVLEKIITDPGDSITGSHSINIRTDITRIKELLWVGLGYWDRWLENEVETDRVRAVESLLAFRDEVFKNEKQLKNPAQSCIGILVNDLECAKGVIRNIDPNRHYGTGEGKYLLKRLSIGEANRNCQDWLNYFAPDSEINLAKLGVQSAEMLRKPLPIDDKDAFILQQDLIGPSSASVLSMLNKSDPNNLIAAKIRETIISHRIHEYMTWRDNVPTLMDEGYYPISQVIDGYIHRWTHFFEKFGQHTNRDISGDQKEAAISAITLLPWDKIITENTLMRYFSGTFRNSVIKTNKVNISAKELIEMFSEGGEVDVDKIKKNMFTIDHSARDTQYMEDLWEILNNPHARLSEDKKLDLYHETRTDKYDMPSDPYTNEAALVMMVYRNCRVADLFKNVYLLKMTAKNQKRILSNEQFKENEQLYINIIQAQINQAIEMTNKLYQFAPNSPLTKLIKPIEACLNISGSEIIPP